MKSIKQLIFLLTSVFIALGVHAQQEELTWEGFDPAELYGLAPDKRTPEWIEEVRFTTKEDVLYVFVLNQDKGKIELPALGFHSGLGVKKISSVRMLGNNKRIRFRQDNENLSLKVPAKRPNN